MKKYQPINSLEVPRFAEIKTFMRLPNVKTTENIDYAVIGIPFDTASSFRSGSRFGPSSIRDISSQLRPYNLNLGVNVVDTLSGVDFGDIPVVPGEIIDTYSRIEKGLQPIVDSDVIPISLGGDHSVTLGELRAIAKKHGPVALVHFDSHLDTIDSYFGNKYNHGTMFRRAYEEGLIDTKHSIQVGIRGTFYSPDDIKESEELGFQVITANEIRKLGFDVVGKVIRERVGDKKAFFSFDIDFVDPAYAPGTGTIEVGGFTSYETMQLIAETKGINFVGFDIVEVLPAYDNGQITAYMAANIGHMFVGLIALYKK